MTLSPDKLRAEAEAVRRKEQRKKAAEQRKKTLAHIAAAKAAMDKVPAEIERAEAKMEYAAKRGDTQIAYELYRGRMVDTRGAHWRDCIQAPAQAVVDHFLETGFKADLKYDNEMEWHSDGAGPGDDVLSLRVDWSKNA